MVLSIDLDTLAVTPAAVSVRRGDVLRVHVSFLQGGVVRELPSDAVGRLVVKKVGDFSGEVVAGSRPWGPVGITPPPAHWRKVGASVNARYIFDLNLNTQQMNDLFLAAAGELAEVQLVLEVEWSCRGMRTTAQRVTFRVGNDYLRSNDVPPAILLA